MELNYIVPEFGTGMLMITALSYHITLDPSLLWCRCTEEIWWQWPCLCGSWQYSCIKTDFKWNYN